MSSFFGRLAKAFRFGNARYYIGRDLDNNKYFEYPPLDGDLDPRRTRRLIRYRVHKELGEHDQSALPIQWLMWLRHTRRSAPSVEELLQDKERIEITQHNARVLEAKDAERRLVLEQKAAEETNRAQQIMQPSQRKAESSMAASPRATSVPTATVSDGEVDQEGHEPTKKVDMEVWEASRRRMEERAAQQDAAFGRSQRRAELDHKDSERERAKRAMTRSPLEDFDVTYEAAEDPQALKPRFGRPVGPGEQWSPSAWSPAPASRR